MSFLILVSGIADTAITWDEANPNFPAARKQATWFRIFFSSGAGLSEEGVRMGFETESDHPSLPRTSMALFRILLPAGVSDRVAFAASTSFWVSIFTAFFFLTLRNELGWLGAAVGTGVLFFHPRWFAHARLAEYDVPIAIAWWAAATAFFRVYRVERRDGVSWAEVCGAAFWFGIALSVKLHAFFLPFPLLLWAVLYRKWYVWKWVAASAVIGPAVYLGTQPYLWWHPFERLKERFIDYSEKIPISVHYLGTTYRGDVPWHYPWVLLAATLPLGFLFLVMAGCVILARHESGKHSNASWILSRSWFVFVGLNAVTIPLLFSFKSPYDGIRLFLITLPYLAMLAAAGMAGILQTIRSRFQPIGKWVAVLMGGLFVAVQAGVCYKLHPLELTYYSSLVGGVPGARSIGLETTYWCEGLTPAFLKRLAETLPEDANISTHCFDAFVLEENQRQRLAPEGWKFNEPGAVTARVLQMRQGFFGPIEHALLRTRKPLLAEVKSMGTPVVIALPGP